MTENKFTSQDRQLVVKELERIQKTSLRSVAGSRKVFTDRDGKFYCIFGGTGDWHGVPESLLRHIEANASKTLLVVAKKYATRIDLCVATADKLVIHKDDLPRTRSGGWQFHIIAEEDGFHIFQIPNLQLRKIGEVLLAHKARQPSMPPGVSQIININMLPSAQTPSTGMDDEATHTDIQAKLILIGTYLGYRTFTSDRSRQSRYGKLGELCSETQVPKDYLAVRQIGVVTKIDVLWFDQDGMPTHCFEVEHTTDVTKGLLRLYQIRKLRIKMYIVAPNTAKSRFESEVKKDPFYQIQEQYVFKTYQELEEFLQSVRRFAELRESFLMDQHDRRSKEPKAK